MPWTYKTVSIKRIHVIDSVCIMQIYWTGDLFNSPSASKHVIARWHIKSRSAIVKGHCVLLFQAKKNRDTIHNITRMVKCFIIVTFLSRCFSLADDGLYCCL